MATRVNKKKRTTASMSAMRRKNGIGFKAWVLVIISAAVTGVAIGRVIQVFVQPLFSVLSALFAR